MKMNGNSNQESGLVRRAVICDSQTGIIDMFPIVCVADEDAAVKSKHAMAVKLLK